MNGEFRQAAIRAGDAAIQFATGIENGTDRVVDLVTGTKELATEMRDNANAAVALERRVQNLRDAQLELNVETARSRAELREQNKIAEDTTRTFEERINAARRTVSIERQLLSQRISLAEENVAIIREQNSLSKNLEEDNQRLADAEIELFYHPGVSCRLRRQQFKR